MIAIFPELVTCAAAADHERLAVLVRLYFGGEATFAPVLETEQLLIGAGIEVQRLPLDYEGALLAKDERGAFRIVAVVRHDLPKTEERFLFAHLLGHYLFDIQPMVARGELHVRGFRESLSPLQRYCSTNNQVAGDREADLDARADLFASCLILPNALVKRAYAKMGAVAPTAQFFGVTLPCLQQRLGAIGATGDQPANFLAAEDRLDPNTRVSTDFPTRAGMEDLVSPMQSDAGLVSSKQGSLSSGKQNRGTTQPQIAVAQYNERQYDGRQYDGGQGMPIFGQESGPTAYADQKRQGKPSKVIAASAREAKNRTAQRQFTKDAASRDETRKTKEACLKSSGSSRQLPKKSAGLSKTSRPSTANGSRCRLSSVSIKPIAD